MDIFEAGSGRTVIGYGEYMKRDDIKNVVVAREVRKLEHSAFRNCLNLESLVLPFHIESIGGYCFAGCTRLKSLTIPSNIMKVEYSAFRQCHSLTDLTVLDNVRGTDPETCPKRTFRIPRFGEYMRWLYIEASMNSFHADMGLYDAVFPRLDGIDDRIEVALYRLENDYQLADYMRNTYSAVLSSSVEYVISCKNTSLLSRIGQLGCISLKHIDYYIEISAEKKSLCTAYLLEYKRNNSPSGSYSFDL